MSILSHIGQVGEAASSGACQSPLCLDFAKFRTSGDLLMVPVSVRDDCIPHQGRSYGRTGKVRMPATPELVQKLAIRPDILLEEGHLEEKVCWWLGSEKHTKKAR
ncbi:hypothetical protein PAAG_06245 [Paracoccidioides lutzii Pb01]|uniref:Uncharacterized protein n=1 Tax=Paracoccidioides lutzii (strain ATCC MYA-826 / Pb01) TaxID=502779 RepID=C1H5Q0_PARBA|nr:hypothetical protein PAAG_06245 [Paracoccidioides lutzii Pb01]EEH35198.2 hypothetical protein PAAG_06245 [Paracoccidioides lutzii Pb01]